MIDSVLLLLLSAPGLVLAAWNIKLLAENQKLKKDLYQRAQWHARELAKWRERL